MQYFDTQHGLKLTSIKYQLSTEAMTLFRWLLCDASVADGPIETCLITLVDLRTPICNNGLAHLFVIDYYYFIAIYQSLITLKTPL